MRLQLHSDDALKPNHAVAYESTVTLRSQSFSGVEFTILRLSFGRRMDLARRVLELSKRLDFHAAGEGLEDNLEANILASEIDHLYLAWGLVAIRGLTVDGAEATPELLTEKGPEELASEIVTAIKAQCGLSESERKN